MTRDGTDESFPPPRQTATRTVHRACGGHSHCSCAARVTSSSSYRQSGVTDVWPCDTMAGPPSQIRSQ
jgi:hypothetical protein